MWWPTPGTTVCVRGPLKRCACCAAGRHGQKTGAGYDRYEGRTPRADPALTAITTELAVQHGIPRRARIDDTEIVERLMFPLVNEGLKILEEGIAYRPGDIDIVWTAGYGFPDHRGGPMWWTDAIGLPHILDRLAHHGRTRGNAFGYWTPSQLLTQLVDQGRPLAGWQRA